MYVLSFNRIAGLLYERNGVVCPFCSYDFVNVIREGDTAIYTCGKCGEVWEVTKATALLEDE